MRPVTSKDKSINRYEGEWQNGEGHGRGVFVNPDGAIYEGYFEKGYRNGMGRTVYADGDYYIG